MYVSGVTGRRLTDGRNRVTTPPPADSPAASVHPPYRPRPNGSWSVLPVRRVTERECRSGPTGPRPPERERMTRKFLKTTVRFLKKEDGPTAVEYAVMLALIIVVCIAAITTLGSNANNTFANVSLNTSGS